VGRQVPHPPCGKTSATYIVIMRIYIGEGALVKGIVVIRAVEAKINLEFEGRIF
jgi:hypothetical protein